MKLLKEIKEDELRKIFKDMILTLVLDYRDSLTQDEFDYIIDRLISHKNKFYDLRSFYDVCSYIRDNKTKYRIISFSTIMTAIKDERDSKKVY